MKQKKVNKRLFCVQLLVIVTRAIQQAKEMQSNRGGRFGQRSFRMASEVVTPDLRYKESKRESHDNWLRGCQAEARGLEMKGV